MKGTVPWREPIPPAALDRLLELSGLDPQVDLSATHLLDFGCGFGRYLDLFSLRIPKQNLVGAEPDRDSLLETREKGYTCHAVKRDDPRLDFASDESFDIVFSSNVIEHIPRPDYLNYLVEIRRVLRPGGRFVVGTPNYPIKRLYDMYWAIKKPGFFRYYFFDDPTHCNPLSIGRLESDLSRLFDEVHLYPTYIAGEGHISILRRPAVRRRLRVLGNKITGYALKRGRLTME